MIRTAAKEKGLFMSRTGKTINLITEDRYMDNGEVAHIAPRDMIAYKTAFNSLSEAEAKGKGSPELANWGRQMLKILRLGSLKMISD
jgi:hypothetical protein